MKRILFLVMSLILVQTIKNYGQHQVEGDLGTPGIHKPGGGNKYIDEGVDLSTGVITPKIHLTELGSYGGQSVSVDLVYTCGQGVHVNDVASRVGLGWQIMTGGSLKRIVHGIRDEKEYSTIPYASDEHYDVGWLTLGDHYYFHYDGWIFRYDVSSPNTMASDYFPDLLNPIYFPNASAGDYNCFQARAIMLNYMIPGKTDMRLDSEPDEFFFSFGPYQGKFVFDEHRQPVLIPHQNIKIELPVDFGGIGTSWVFTTPDGMKYIFEDNDTYRTRTQSSTYYEGFNGADARTMEYNSEWNLSKIIGNGTDLFTFSYNSKPDYSIRFKVSNQLIHAGYTQESSTNWTDPFCYDEVDDNLGDCPFVQGIIGYERRLDEKEIQEIASPFGTISFENESYPNFRLDMWHYYSTSNQYALKSIKKHTAEGQLVKHIEFETGYFNGGAGNIYDNFWPTSVSDENLYKSANQLDRLKLISLNEYATNTSGSPPPLKYSFQYDQSLSYEPFYCTGDQDLLGFYKDNPATSLNLCGNTQPLSEYGLPYIPMATYTPNENAQGTYGIHWLYPFVNGSQGNIPGTNHFPTNESKALILTGVTHPSGLKSTYEYELNDYQGSHYGLRIKNVRHRDMHGSVPGNEIETQYSYPFSGTTTSDFFQRRLYELQRYYCSADNFHIYLQRSTTSYRTYDAELIRYSKVEVDQTNAGKTIFEMTSFADILGGADQPDEPKVRKSIFTSGGCEPCMEDVVRCNTGTPLTDPSSVTDFTNDYDDDPGAPNTDMGYRRGLVTSIKYYQTMPPGTPVIDYDNYKVKELSYTYDFDATANGFVPKEVTAYRVSSSAHIMFDNHSDGHALPQYNVDVFKYHSGIITLTNSAERNYEIVDGIVNPLHFSTKSTTLNYLFGDPTKLKSKIIHNQGSNGNYFEEYKYASEYTNVDPNYAGTYADPKTEGIKQLLLHNMGGVPVEVISGFQDGVAANGLTDWVNGGKIITYKKSGIGQYSFVYPYETYQLETDVPLYYYSFVFSDVNMSEQFTYDNSHYVLKSESTVNSNNLPVYNFSIPENYSSVQYGYGGRFPVAKFSNAKITLPKQECSYEGFEHLNNVNDVGWGCNISTQLIYNSASSHTGNYYFKINPLTTGPLKIFDPFRQVGKKYKFSAWIKTSSGFGSGSGILSLRIMAGTNNNLQTISIDNTSDWKYYEVVIDMEEFFLNNAVNPPVNLECKIVNNHNAAFIYADDIRFSPYYCDVTTYTYNSRYQISSESNSRSFPVYYYYDDEWARLTHTENEKHKLLTANEYYVRPWNNIGINDKHWTAEYKFIREANWSGGWSEQDYIKTKTYTDDFGRTIQTQAIKQSPSRKHIVKYHEYENLSGKKLFDYLPYTIGGEESYRPSAKMETYDFYDNTNIAHPQNVASTSAPQAFPCSETVFDNSPLSQIVQRGSAGDDWQCTMSASATPPLNPHPKKIDYSINQNIWVNNVDDFVRVWFLKAGGGAQAPFDHEYGALFKTITTDEDGNTTWTYHDKIGNVLLKRIFMLTAIDPQSGNKNSTFDFTKGGQTNIVPTVHFVSEIYYVYDEFGRKAYEIPPAAVQLFKEEWLGGNANAFSFIEDPADFAFWELIYAYKYDKKGRLIRKKSPGIDWISYVYDKNDRIILSQNPKQAASALAEWSFTKYDEGGRSIMSGIFKTNDTQQQLQTIADNAATKLYEKRTADFTIDHGYTNNAFPILLAADEVLTADYYDTYDAVNWAPFNTSPYPATNTTLTFGEKTAGMVRTLNALSNTDLLTVYYYDDHYNVIQENAQNHLGGADIYYRDFDWSSKLMNMKRVHTNSNQLPTSLTLYKRYEYDLSGRMINEFERIDPDSEIKLAHYEYNELGQLIKKSLHETTDNSITLYLQNIDYRYNIRGWIKKINNSNLDIDDDNPDMTDVFGEDLIYTKDDKLNAALNLNPPSQGFTINECYNGNIAAMLWKNKSPLSDPVGISRHIYAYRYDAVNRMTAGYYARSDNFIPSNFINDEHWFDETVSYDIHGNPNSLQRRAGVNFIDKLVYDYIDYTSGIIEINGNRLKAISDNALQNGHGFTEPALPQIQEYYYDVNGSVIDDQNKAATTAYTNFDLPSEVNLTGNGNGTSPGTIQYIYDATGRKLTEMINTHEHQYVDGIEFIGGRLKHVLTSEGKVRPKSLNSTNTSEFVYDYFIKDHLDNVRVVITEERISNAEVATMETANAVTEDSLFMNIDETRANQPATAPIDNTYLPNLEVSELNLASNNTVGFTKVLALMEGDQVDFDTKYYFTAMQSGAGNPSPLENIMNQLGTLFSASFATGTLSPEAQSAMSNAFTQNPNLTTFLTTLLADTDSLSITPHAFLTWLYFDKNFKFVEDASGVMRADQPDVLGELAQLSLTAPVDGFLYVYVSNESNHDVIFDNLRIAYNPGRVTQVINYYPYGLPIRELTTPGYIKNNGNDYMMTTKEWNTDFGFNEYDFGARNYDPAVIRWYVQDPAEQFHNPYFAIGGNPVVSVDPDGNYVVGATLTAAIIVGAAIGGATYAISTAIQGHSWNWGSFAKSIGIGAVSGAVSFGIGSAFASAGSVAIETQIANEVGRAFFHGVTGEMINGFTGGTPSMSGFYSSAFSSLAGSAFSGSPAGLQAGASMGAGGISSALSGGSFWEGFASGAIVTFTNHLINHECLGCTRAEIAETAESYIGSDAWDYDKSNDNFPSGSHKCNKFVYDVLDESGANPGKPNGIFHKYPPTAEQWADPKYKIKGWKVVTNAKRGDIAAQKVNYSDATGHTAVVVSPRGTVGTVNSRLIGRTDWGFRPGQSKVVFRRYVGSIFKF